MIEIIFYFFSMIAVGNFPGTIRIYLVICRALNARIDEMLFFFFYYYYCSPSIVRLVIWRKIVAE